MNIFKRLTASFSGSIESAVSQLENHDAVVQAVLKDTRALAARAKVRLTRVQQDDKRLHEKLQSLVEMEQAWSRRALACADQDEAKALECLQRRNQCREQIDSVKQALKQHQQQARRLQETVLRIEQRLAEIEHTRNLLRSRQTSAEATRAVHRLESDSPLDLDDVLERWEMRILETEYATPSDQSADSFEAEFANQENINDLRSELDELKQQEQDNG